MVTAVCPTKIKIADPKSSKPSDGDVSYSATFILTFEISFLRKLRYSCLCLMNYELPMIEIYKVVCCEPWLGSATESFVS